ncbi:DUF934 domain-containing protein [Mesorhizobium sp.]|uniref:DUF934 domain-containing protein n=1 Tax=Mesorhizobium sp. TaxID=1871066 RepID=UPI000FE9927B|nr:DUF934 domain-containing protein [Mesorhizobium sp.]RWM71562.1 MAG: DUF934 domain-containing protein [Mesorhizobium sp.]TIO24729.1 MAG: DUF934 domain-containing protein [Mesorhizobium sp.]TJV56092.1 MAG: DUF934 domain-containing protein [Mesorhizobium sp.]
MTELTPETITRLWTPKGFREDEWTHAESADALSGNGRFILPLQVFLDLDPAVRRSAKERIGVLLQPGDQLEKIADLLDQISLVALAFPAFSDGRSFSKGELLRSRYHFEGAVRATGQVLVDQLSHMLRLGFDEFEVSHPVLLKRLEEGRTGGLPLYYQPTERPEAKGPKYSWRRVRAG